MRDRPCREAHGSTSRILRALLVAGSFCLGARAGHAAEPAGAEACLGGQTRVEGRCCWPGQKPGPGASCTGVPECPEGTLSLTRVENPTCAPLPKLSRSPADDSRCTGQLPEAYACDLDSFLRGGIRFDLTVDEIAASRDQWKSAARSFCTARAHERKCKRASPGPAATRAVEQWCCPRGWL